MSPTRQVVRTTITVPSPKPTSTALVSTRPSPVLFLWRPLTSCQATPANRPSRITYFNYRKDSYKSPTCLEPRKPRIIYKINKEGELDNLDYTDDELGKEDA